MKEIKQISFSEMLLVPARNRFESNEYPYSHYKGHICGENEEMKSTVHILLFNCSLPGEIPSLVDLEIQNLEKYISENPHVEEIKSQIEFFLILKKELSDKQLHHSPPDELIQFISENCLPELKKENVLFLSGVSSLVEG